MGHRGQSQNVYINAKYVRQYFKAQHLSLASESVKIGKSNGYLSVCLTRKEIDKTAMLLLCHNTEMDYKKATEKEVAEKKTATVQVKDGTHQDPVIKQGVTSEELKELTELVITYIQDLGKIHTDTLRELKETKTLLKEMTEKHNREFHELDVYIRNAGAEARKSREAMNNTLSKTHNYLERKLEQQK